MSDLGITRNRQALAGPARAGLSALALATALLWSGAASAQTVPADDTTSPPSDVVQSIDLAPQDKDIVVTGTLLRGVAPTGTNVIGVSRDNILENGAASSNDLLASIPQIGNFGTVPIGTGQFGAPTVRPNIRNLGASGGSTTLVLLNGHRIVGAGILQTTADPSIIPPDVIDRLEIIPDGGSSIYGSDAIGGVVNFITRKRFDGVGGSIRYGFADNYRTVDGNLTLGKDWGSGSLLVSYAYAWHDNILNRQRSYVSADNTQEGGPDLRSTTCSPGNVTVGGINYALPGFTANTTNKCEQNAWGDLYPREQRHSVFASLTQKLDSHVDFSMTAYWSRRDTIILEPQGTLTGTVTAFNPYFHSITGELAQNVALSFAGALGNSLTSRQRFDSYGTSPSFSFALGKGWQLRAESNLGRSYSVVREGAINTTVASAALNGLTTATALNPYNPAASNPALLASIADFENFGDATQELAEGRLILDGSLARLPGGDVKLAIGAEYHYENLASRISLDRRNVFTNAINSSVSRDVKSVFGEVLVPIFGADNGTPGMRGLQISGSVRYDSYSDVGGTTNPKVGVNYKPFDDLVIRGNYGTSFHAPSLADTTSTADSRAQILLFSPFLKPGDSPLNFLRPTIVLAGGNPNLKPERADTWSVGFDWTPRAIAGLTVNVTYYNVKFKDAIGLAPFLLPTLYTDPNYKNFYILNPTLAQSQAAVGTLLLNGAPSLQSLYVGTSPYVLIDARRNNLGAVNTDGLDFNLSYVRKTGFGAISANFAGTYTLSRKSEAIAGGAFSDDLANGVGRFNFVATLGGKIYGVTARAALNYKGGYPILGVAPQTRVDAFKTVDLFLGYDLAKTGPLKNTMLTLNVDNVFDQDPPYLNSSTGYTNGSTLGRLVSFGLRTKF
jgi:iron complex outermembrane receptor protein